MKHGLNERRPILAAVALGAMLVSATCARHGGGASHSAGTVSAAAGAPALAQLVPDSIVVMRGMVAEVEIRGQRFDGNQATPGNTVSVGTVVLNGVRANAEGTVIRFVVPDAVPSGAEAPPSPWMPGRYAVTVRTPLGVSDTLYLTIGTARTIRP